MTCTFALSQPRDAREHACRVGGGLASCTDDGGKSWFCWVHRPNGWPIAPAQAPLPPPPEIDTDPRPGELF